MRILLGCAVLLASTLLPASAQTTAPADKAKAPADTAQNSNGFNRHFFQDLKAMYVKPYQDLVPQNDSARSESFGQKLGHYVLVNHNLIRYRLRVQGMEVVERRRRDGIGSPSYAAALDSLAQIYLLLGRYAEAEPACVTALQIRRRVLGEQHPDYATSCSRTAVLYQALGRPADARPLAERALAVRQQVLGMQHPATLQARSELGLTYQTLGLTQPADSLARVLQEFIRKHPIQDKTVEWYTDAQHQLKSRPLPVPDPYVAGIQYAQLLGQQSDFEYNRRHYPSALWLSQQAVALTSNLIDPSEPASYLATGRMCRAYDATGEHGKAGFIYGTLRLSAGRMLGKESREYARLYDYMALHHEWQGNYVAAVKAGSQATNAYEQLLRNTFGELNEQEKRQLLTLMAGSLERYHSLVAGLPAKRRAEALGTAYNQVLFTKGLLLSATTALERQLRASPDTAVRRQLQQWQLARRQLAAALSLPLAEQAARHLDLAQLAQEANDLEKRLTVRATALAGASALTTTTWQQVQQALHPGEVAAEIVRYRWFRHEFTDSIYYAVYLLAPGQAAPQLVLLRNGHDLETTYLAAYHRLMRAPGSSRGAIEVTTPSPTDTLSLRSVAQALWQPIARALPAGTTTLYLSADGVYQQVNLTTLQPSPAAGQAGELRLHQLGSTRELLAAPAVASDGTSVLVGAPAFRLPPPPVVAAHASPAPVVKPAGNRRPGPALHHPPLKQATATATPPKPAAPVLVPAGLTATSPVTSPATSPVTSPATSPATVLAARAAGDLLAAGSVIPPLPGTAREVASLDSLLGAAGWPHQRYTGPAATEEAVRDLHHPRLLHVATHGFFQAATVRDTLTHTSAATDPMLRSGLLLAGVSTFRDAPEKPATEDGILTAYEAALLDLQGTELVVLSACETGLGQVQNGEGVYGLQRGFTVAGAKSILMSLWKVDDAVTQELMAAFYHSWLGGRTKRAALLAAQQQVRQQHPEPYFWGAFVLVGE